MLKKPVVIYDGSCGICGGNLHWLYKFDLFKRFDALPYQSEELSILCPQVSIAECEQALHLVFPDGKVYKGADAFREVFLRMPLSMPVGIFMSIPPMPWILQRLYPLLAENRYKLGGHCSIENKLEKNK